MTTADGKPDAESVPGRGAAAVKRFQEEKLAEDQQDARLLSRLYPYVGKHRLTLVVSIVLMPAVAATAQVLPYLEKLAIDHAVVPHDRPALTHYAAMIGGVLVFELALRALQAYLMQRVGQHVMAGLRRHLFAYVQELRTSYFDRTPVGRVVARITSDVDALGEVFASGAVTAIVDVLSLAAVVTAMLLLDWRMTIIAFVVLPPLLVTVQIFRRRARQAFRAIRAKTAQIHAAMSEQVQGVGVVQAYTREDAMMADFAALNDEYLEANRRSIRLDAMLYSVVESTSVVCVAAILWYAGVRAQPSNAGSSGAITIGTLVAFVEYVGRFFVPIRDFAQKYTVIQASLASAERVFAFLDVDERDAPPDEARSIAAGNAPPARDPEAVVGFESVVFGYRENEPVLRGIDLSVKRGEHLALVGSTGAGKSTLAALLQRLHDVDEGRVVAFGEDVRAMDRRALRRHFAVVPQDVYLFSGTVLENVAMGDVEPDRDKAEAALSRVGAMDMLRRRGSEGLDARVSERGQNFSAGERQLMAFARALYRDADLLVLDEATASVDSETEAALQRAVDEVMKGRTAIVIAHRLSTIRASDRIVVLHRGRVAEQGSHDELVAQGGLYAKLHKLQFQVAA